MISAWMAYAIVLTAFACVAAELAEHVMWIWRTPRRVPWLIAIAISFFGPLVLPFVNGSPRPAPVATPGIAAANDRLTVGVGHRNPAPARMPTAFVSATRASHTTGVAISFEPLLIRGSIVSASLAVLYLLITCARFRRQLSTWREIELDGTRVLVAPRQGPAVVGAWRSRIVIPEWSLSLDAGSRSLMLRHEREHIAARDPLYLFLAAVAVALVPWNAPLWLMMRGLRRAIELDCDRRVLRAGFDVERYGSLLLEFAAHRVRPLGLAAGLVESRSLLERRIRVMTAMRPRRPFLLSVPVVSSIAVVTLGAARTDIPRSPFHDARVRGSSSAMFSGPTTSPAITGGALLSAPVTAARSGVRLARVRSEPRMNADWENAPIQYVIAAFESFSHHRIITSPEVNGFITAHIVDQPWTAALKSIMSFHGFEVTFNADSTIAIKLPKPARDSVPSERVEQQPSREITGTVTDAETGRGIGGVRINVAGTQAIGEPNEAWSNDRGAFSLRGPNGEVWLDACAAGYEFPRVTLAPRDSVASFQGRRTATFARDTALYGSVFEPRVAGIPVQPLYVVDGRPVGPSASRRPPCGQRGSMDLMNGGIWIRPRNIQTIGQSVPSLCILNGKQAPCDDVLKMINKDEPHIEKVEILKGALAASLYGDRAEAGVLVVSSRP